MHQSFHIKSLIFRCNFIQLRERPKNFNIFVFNFLISQVIISYQSEVWEFRFIQDSPTKKTSFNWKPLNFCNQFVFIFHVIKFSSLDSKWEYYYYLQAKIVNLIFQTFIMINAIDVADSGLNKIMVAELFISLRQMSYNVISGGDGKNKKIHFHYLDLHLIIITYLILFLQPSLIVIQLIKLLLAIQSLNR